jgi:hypothetical protein
MGVILSLIKEWRILYYNDFNDFESKYETFVVKTNKQNDNYEYSRFSSDSDISNISYDISESSDDYIMFGNLNEELIPNSFIL